MGCQCSRCRGLGDIDWSGIFGNAVKAYGAIEANRSALALQRAQADQALRMQQAEIQRMQRSQNALVAQPVDGHMIVPNRPMMASGLPSWALPAAVGLGVLLLVRR